jgi:hypothetical protein
MVNRKSLGLPDKHVGNLCRNDNPKTCWFLVLSACQFAQLGIADTKTHTVAFLLRSKRLAFSNSNEFGTYVCCDMTRIGYSEAQLSTGCLNYLNGS